MFSVNIVRILDNTGCMQLYCLKNFEIFIKIHMSKIIKINPKDKLKCDIRLCFGLNPW